MAPGNNSFVYLAILNDSHMDFQLVTGGSGYHGPPGLYYTFTTQQSFLQSGLCRNHFLGGLRTGTYDVLQSAKGTQRLTFIKDGGHWRAGGRNRTDWFY